MDMIIPFDVRDSNRKHLAGEVGVDSGRPAIYLKYPTCNYRIGEFLLDEDGRLIIPDTVAGNVIDELIEQPRPRRLPHLARSP